MIQTQKAIQARIHCLLMFLGTVTLLGKCFNEFLKILDTEIKRTKAVWLRFCTSSGLGKVSAVKYFSPSSKQALTLVIKDI